MHCKQTHRTVADVIKVHRNGSHKHQRPLFKNIIEQEHSLAKN